MDFTNYLANKLIGATVGNEAYVTPAKVYLALHKSDPTKEGLPESELNKASYSRKEVTFTEPIDGVSTNANQVDWNTATTDWGNVKWVSVMDSLSSGNMLYFTSLDNPEEILSGEQFQIDVGKLTLKLT